MGRRRVAVTGIGVVAAPGVGRDAFWEGLHRAPAEGGELRVTDFDPAALFDNPKTVRRTDRFTHLALGAVAEALEMAGGPADGLDPDRAGVWWGTGVGGIETSEKNIGVFLDKGPKRVTPFFIPMVMCNAAAAWVSMNYGFQGPAQTTVTACAASTHAIGNAARLIQRGRCDVVVTGGSEAPHVPVCTAAFRNMTALSTSGNSRPFDRRRDGFVMSEGGGALVLEEWDHAVARGATILAEVLGSASTADAHHVTAPAPGGAGAINCIQLALEDAGVAADAVTYVNAHGTSTPLNDAAEAAALTKVFGTESMPAVTSIKGANGHSLGGAGAIEAVSVVLSMMKRSIPPTVGHEEADPELPAIDLVVGSARDWEPGVTISNSFGFGGHNGTVVLGPPES